MNYLKILLIIVVKRLILKKSDKSFQRLERHPTLKYVKHNSLICIEIITSKEYIVKKSSRRLFSKGKSFRNIHYGKSPADT